jgi:hypothetical protein
MSNENEKTRQSKIILAQWRILSNETQDFNVGTEKKK